MRIAASKYQAMGLDPFLLLCRAEGLPIPEREVLFHETRKWRFDYCWRPDLIAIEQEGAIWISGRHTRGTGFEADCVKYAEANLLGWTVFRASPKQMTDGTAIGWLKRALL